jgi:tyrosyl-tRNA synthetase
MRLIQAKGLYLNNKPVQFERYKLTRTDLIDDKVAILRTGKSKHLILAVS